MPVYNGEKYISEAVHSICGQTYQNWELLVINDGSTDNTKSLVKQLSDKRILYFEQPNKGVGAARNIGLDNMSGDYFCFLDADDVMPPDSLSSRLRIFQDSSEICFVDGRVLEMSEDLTSVKRDYKPSFTGNPFSELLKLKESCYLGQTWMIKRRKEYRYQMETDQTHGEDLFFFLTISKNGGVYKFTQEITLYYRRRGNSAMANLQGLDHSYIKIYNKIRKWPEVSSAQATYFWLKTRKVMFLSHLFDGNSFTSAFTSIFNK